MIPTREAFMMYYISKKLNMSTLIFALTSLYFYTKTAEYVSLHVQLLFYLTSILLVGVPFLFNVINLVYKFDEKFYTKLSWINYALCFLVITATFFSKEQNILGALIFAFTSFFNFAIGLFISLFRQTYKKDIKTLKQLFPDEKYFSYDTDNYLMNCFRGYPNDIRVECNKGHSCGKKDLTAIIPVGKIEVYSTRGLKLNGIYYDATKLNDFFKISGISFQQLTKSHIEVYEMYNI